VTQPEPEDVTTIGKLADKKYEVYLTFSKDAGEAMSQLMINLGVASANEVAKRAIALLLEASGKEIILRDPKTGQTKAIDMRSLS
jgi:hypothetical protein